jgi:RNA polymerase sigma factor (TIGR02999 family)
MSDITALLASAGAGDEKAASTAFSLLYEELKRLAQAKLRRHQTITLLDTTSLVHESFLKLVGNRSLAIRDRRHFFTYAARVMRSVIVDFARARLADRRSGEAQHVTLDTGLGDQLAAPEHDLLRVNEALEVLAAAEPRLAQVVEMRYFGGLTELETAELLGLTERTIRRDWNKAKLLLAAALEEDQP